MSEQLNNPNGERLKNSELAEAAGEQLKKLERGSETFNESEQKYSAERARHDAEKLAIAGKERGAGENKTGGEPSVGTTKRITRKVKNVQYKQTMKDVQDELSAPSKAFSKIIHNKAVERASDVTGKTLARPNAILAGSLTACVLVATVYILAKIIGFRLSGFETIAAFIVGWLAGILIDILRVAFTRRSF